MFSKHKPTPIDIKGIEAIKYSLAEDGYAVVSVPSIDLNELKTLFARDMSEITGRSVDFPELWQPGHVKIPDSSHPGLLGEYGLSQGNAAWYVRTNKDIIDLYKLLLGADRIVCSMDAIGFSQDPDQGPVRGSDQCPAQGLHRPLWLHVDQNPHAWPGADLNSIQGIFYAEDSFGERAGTIVAPCSHKDWLMHQYHSDRHFQIIGQQNKYFSRAVKLEIPAGCLLLFSSKLVHQGMYGPHRLCFMICYGDAKDRSEQIRKRKIVMYLGGHRSSHWSQFGIYHGWKWAVSHWNILFPRTTRYDDRQINMIEAEMTDPSWYHIDMDQLVPEERLALL
jgi:hypothetical protein